MSEELARILLDKQGGEIFRHVRSTQAQGASTKFVVRLGQKIQSDKSRKLRIVADKLRTPVTSAFVTFQDASKAQRAWELSSRHI